MVTPILAYLVLNWLLYFSVGFISVKVNAFISGNDKNKMIVTGVIFVLSIPFLLDGIEPTEKEKLEEKKK